MALRNLGIDYEVVAMSDVDEFTINSYAAIHDSDKPVSEATDEEMQDYLEKRNIPLNNKGVRKILKGNKLREFYEACIKSNNLGDISNVETQNIPDHDLFTYSFPCFTGDSLVLTDDGYKRIDEINIEDMVLTHTNQYKKVTNVFNQGVKDIVNVKGMAIHNIKTTENHKFLTRERYRLWNNDKRYYDRLFHEPKWVEAKDLTRSHYLGLAINQKSELPVWGGYTNSWDTGYGVRTHHSNLIKPLLGNNDFWWLMGRYIADGWHRSQGGIVIAVPDSKLEDFENRVNKLFDYSISRERTVNKIHIPIKELELFTEQFGYYAHGKKISSDVLNLPADLLRYFIEGYFSGDGSYSEGTKLYKCTSTSEELIYGIGQCVAKVYHRPYAIYKTNRPDTHVIEGRTVNQRDTYSLIFKMVAGKQDQAFYEDGHIWFPFDKLENNGKETVYDIEVEDDHSFTVFNTIVHNCQDISVAGKGLGLNEGSDTRSGLLWECQKVIDGKRPKYLLLENVKNLVGKKHKHNFDKWLEWLEEQGYTNYWQVLNAKDYGVPQNRERVFVVSILGEHEPYEFPEPIELELRLKDVLESEVDEKFYLDTDKANKLIATIASKYEIKEPTPTDGGLKNPKPKEVANTILARYDAGISNQQSTETMVVEPKAERIGGIFDKDGKKHQAGAIWDKNQVSPTLDTMQGGWRQPSVVIGASRGRNTENTSDRTVDSPTEQQLEINKQGTSNAITTVQKDNYVIEPKDKSVIIDDTMGFEKEARVYTDYSPSLRASRSGLKTIEEPQLRIRKLTPKECWRLMGFSDDDFHKAEKVNSNSQLYKQAGNSIVVDVLEGIFKQLFEK